MPTQQNQKALLLPVPRGDFILGTTTIATPPPDNILVRNVAVALNPVEWKIQRTGFGAAVMTFPAVIGADFAGVVVSVGEGVNGADGLKFKEGDRVVAQGDFPNERAAYQEYTIASVRYTAKIPAKVSFEEAASLPIGLMTAATGLYQKGTLGAGLRAPWEEKGRGFYKGTPMLIVGGASSVGCYAIQLAKLSGFAPIYTTASLKHTTYLESLGATRVIDRGAPLDSVLAGAQFDTIFDTISELETQRASSGLLAPGGTLVLVHPSSLNEKVGKLKAGMQTKSVYGSAFHPENALVGAGVFGNLEEYLCVGDIKTNRVEVLPGGLGGIVGGLSRLERGTVSGTKLVVRPGETE